MRGAKSPPHVVLACVLFFRHIAAVAVVVCSTHAPESGTAVSAAHLVWFVFGSGKDLNIFS